MAESIILVKPSICFNPLYATQFVPFLVFFFLLFLVGAVKILTCDSPASIKYRTITFKRFSGGNALLFQPGQTYYLIGM